MEYYKKVLKDYAVFTGRTNRKEFWMFVLVNFLIGFALGIIGGIIRTGDILMNIYSLAVLVPTIAVGIRRLHDTGKSGWWILLSLIPILGIIALIVLFVQDSQPGSNKYGSNATPLVENPNSTTPPTASL